ncbi:hypothetical protein ACXZ1K_16025 [Pedobacter sp. PWIIR3]
MKKNLNLLIAFLTLSSQLMAQIAKTGRLENGLIFYSPMDDSNSPTVTLKRISLSLDEKKPPIFLTGNLNYPEDKGLIVGSTAQSFLSLLDFAEDKEKRTLVFWFKIDETNPDSTQVNEKFRNLECYFSSDKSLSIHTAESNGKPSLILEKRIDSTKVEKTSLSTMEIGKWYMLSVPLSYDDKNYQIKLFSAKGTTFSEDRLKNLDIFATSLKALPAIPQIFLNLSSAKGSSICINDLRFYDRILEELDYWRLSTFTTDNYLEIAKYELAYTNKKLADEYFIANKPELAKHRYTKAWEMFEGNPSKKIILENLKEINPMYETYFKLLEKDIQYRQSLIQQGYSFWGQDFSNKPLFPVNELKNFKKTYENFQAVYSNIEKSLDKIDLLNEQQMKENISKLTKTYEADIAATQTLEKNYKIDFYQDQENSITGRLSAISFRNKQIENEVKSKNKQLDANEAKMTSAVTSMITQSVIGVPLDPGKSVGSNLKALGTTLISTNPELRNSLLGSQNDLVNLANVSLDYYNKSKQALKAVEDVANGDLSTENLLSIGNTMADLEIIPQSDWKNLQDKYQQVRGNIAQVKNLENDAKKLIQLANFANNPNLDNISQFMEWASNTDYFPEGKKYSGLYTQVSENLRRKKYDSFFELGGNLLLKSEAASELKENITTLRTKYYQMKPIVSIIERIEKDSVKAITASLAEVLLNKNFWPEIKDFKIQRFLMTAISNCLAVSQNMETRRKLMDALLKKTPDICLNFIPPKAKDDIKLLHEIQDDNALITQLKKATITIDAEQKFMSIKSGTIELFSIRRDSILVGDKTFVFVFNGLQSRSFDHLTILNNLFSEQSLREGIFESMGAAEWYSFLGPKNISDPELIYDRVFKNLKDKGAQNVINAIKSDGFQAYVGANVFQSYQEDKAIPKEIPPLDPEEFYSKENSSDASGAAARAAAASAIDMAFPGYGTVANKALEIAGNILDSYDLIDQLKDLYNEQKALQKELVEQLEKLKANSFNQKLAYFEKDIAELNLELAKKQKDEFSKMQFEMIADNQIEKRNKLGYQLPIFYYYAERLRYYYNRLFRASTFWYGEKNTLADIIEADQSNIRLALDQSINLYKWIRQPDISSMRQDVDKLESYWNTQYTLITEPETEEKIKFGSFDILSHSFTIDKNSTPIAENWDKFIKWRHRVKDKNETKDFEFNLDMESYMRENVANYDKADMEPKVIDVAIAAINNKNGLINSPASNLEVFHPGITIKKDGSIVVLEERKSDVIASKLELRTDQTLSISEVPKSLHERWEPNNYKPKTFEGYDLNSKWKIRVKPNPAAVNIENIILQLSYQYRDRDAKDKTSSFSSYRIHIEHNNGLKQDFRMDLSLEKYHSMMESFQKALETKKITKGKIELIVNPNKTTDVLIN